MNPRSEALLRELTEAPGAPGYEGAVADILQRELSPIGDCTRDNLGSFICRKEGDKSEPKVLLIAHMDEVSFMVKHVTSKGFIRFTPLGGWHDPVLLSSRVVVHTHKGALLGVIGSKPPHIVPPEDRKKPVPKGEMFIDVGAKDAKDAARMGVRPGDPIIPEGGFAKMGRGYLAKAMDNRAGCALMVETLTKAKRHPNVLYGAASAQEEVGARGARTVAQTVMPDVCIVAEVGIAADVPGAPEESEHGVVGRGPQIFVFDAGLIPNLRLRDLAVSICEKAKIPYQFSAMERGATDAMHVSLTGSGVPSLYIGAPSRYIHSAASFLHARDYDNTLKLLLALAKALDAKTVAALTVR